MDRYGGCHSWIVENIPWLEALWLDVGCDDVSLQLFIGNVLVILVNIICFKQVPISDVWDYIDNVFIRVEWAWDVSKL